MLFCRKLRGRRGRGNNQGRGHHGGGGGGGGGAAAGGGQRRNRLMWDRDDLRPNKFRQNKRLSTPHASQDDFISVESCCPTIYEIVEPLAGKNRTGIHQHYTYMTESKITLAIG